MPDLKKIIHKYSLGVDYTIKLGLDSTVNNSMARITAYTNQYFLHFT